MSAADLQPKPRKARRIPQIVAFTIVWLSAIFWSAGTLRWPEGWVYVALYLASVAAGGFMARRRNPGIFEARANWRHQNTKAFDRVFLALYLPLTIVELVAGGFDVVRFRHPAMAIVCLYAGVTLFVVSTPIVAWVMAVNRFAETTVRIQTERGHAVVTSGPYRFVRHPMYLGLILMFLGTGLVLRSRWSLAIGAVIGALFLARTAMEDRTLRRELPGYEEFTTRTRYRLVPGLW